MQDSCIILKASPLPPAPFWKLLAAGLVACWLPADWLAGVLDNILRLRGLTFGDFGTLFSTGGFPGVSRDPFLAPKVEKEGKSSLQKDVFMVLWVPFGQLEGS